MAEPRLAEKREKDLKAFAEMMEGLYGSSLVSLNLVGEAAVEASGRHPVKLLAVMAEVGPDVLRKYAGVYARWHRRGIPAPLMLTEHMLKSSTDVFPMEFLEMKEEYVLLCGRDVLSGLEIGLENLRRECEEQVKGKLIHLRQGYMEAGGDKKALTALIASSIGPFTEVMRNILRLMDKAVPVHKDEVIKEFCSAAGLDEAPFAEALRLRRLGVEPRREEVESLFERYLAQIGLLAEKVDRMTGPRP